MIIRIHLAVGSTAKAKVVEFSSRPTFREFAGNLNAAQQGGTVTTFVSPNGSWAVTARSIVLVEEVTS